MVRDWLWSIIDRYKEAQKRWPPYHSIKTILYLSINDARMIWATNQWMRRYGDWVDEATRSGGNVGVWPSEFGLIECRKFLEYCIEQCDLHGSMVITINAKGMRVLVSCSEHMDHYHLMVASSQRIRRRTGRK